MSLEGRLQDDSLLEVIRLLHASGKEGKLTVQAHGKIGFIYFKGGEIVSAKLGTEIGDDAIYRMTLWELGEYRFDLEPVSQPRTTKLGHHNLVQEASRRFSEWKVIAKKIPSVDMIPEFVPQTQKEAPQISLSTNEWVLLSKVDGRRDIRAISEGSKFGLFETCKIFYGLISSGLLRVRKPSEVSAERKAKKTAQPAPATPEPKKTDLPAAARALLDIGSRYLGSFASGIIEKSLRKAKVNLNDPDTERQIFYLKRAVDFIQRSSSTILGPEIAAKLATELDDAIEQHIQA